MKNNNVKKLLGIGGLSLAILLLASCTANFCSENDRASISYPYEQGVTLYVTEEEFNAYAEENPTVIAYQESIGAAGPAYAAEVIDTDENGLNTYDYSGHVWKYIPSISYYGTSTAEIYLGGYQDYTAAKASDFMTSVIESANGDGLKIPTMSFFAMIDDKVLTYATEAAAWAGGEGYDYDEFVATRVYVGSEDDFDNTMWAVNPYNLSDTDGTDEDAEQISHSILRTYGYLKFSDYRFHQDGTYDGEGTYFGNYEAWVNEARSSNDPYLGLDGSPNSDFYSTYYSFVYGKVSSIASCIVTVNNPDGYGHYGANSDWRVTIEQKSWSYAWSKGFLEGLLVYPISWMVDTFASGMDPALSGVGQIFSLIFVTLIVRGLMLLITFKNTLDQQKMAALQPQLAKLQAKYPNSNTNQAEKQRLGQEQAALYKRAKINPLSQLLLMIIQFPVFICVWSGLSGSAALSTGQVLNLRLSDTIYSVLFNFSEGWYANSYGWWTALVLYLLMATAQIMAMLLPRIVQKVRAKRNIKLGKNPGQDATQNKMKWVTYIMLGFTLIMGFMLPSAMGVYWLISGLIALTQSAITQAIAGKRMKKRGY